MYAPKQWYIIVVVAAASQSNALREHKKHKTHKKHVQQQQQRKAHALAMATSNCQLPTARSRGPVGVSWSGRAWRLHGCAGAGGRAGGTTGGGDYSGGQASSQSVSSQSTYLTTDY